MTFIRFASVPRILKLVYPTPAPASEEATKDGVKLNKYGISCPTFLSFITSLSMFVKATGTLSETLVAKMITSSLKINAGSRDISR
ncbi:hypothetical protein ES708_04748 [subsurface metagenome]